MIAVRVGQRTIALWSSRKVGKRSAPVKLLHPEWAGHVHGIALGRLANLPSRRHVAAERPLNDRLCERVGLRAVQVLAIRREAESA